MSPGTLRCPALPRPALGHSLAVPYLWPTLPFPALLLQYCYHCTAWFPAQVGRWALVSSAYATNCVWDIGCGEGEGSLVHCLPMHKPRLCLGSGLKCKLKASNLLCCLKHCIAWHGIVCMASVLHYSTSSPLTFPGSAQHSTLSLNPLVFPSLKLR